MDPLSSNLRRILGRARFGVYALPRNRIPVLLGSSPDWPHSAAGGRSLLHAARAIPPGHLRRASDDTILLPVGEENGRRGALIVKAGPRAAVWRLGSRQWTEVGRQIRAALDREQESDPQEVRSRDDFHEALLSELPLGVLTVDSNGRATYVSPLAGEILGIPPGEGIGADCRPHFECAGLGENPIRLGFAGKLHRFETYLIARDGSERPAWVQMSRIPSSASPPAGRRREAGELLILIRDTSEERVIEEETRRRERLASIGELSAGVAHEIRNPLTGIGNCAQVLRDRILPDDPRMRFVQIILDEAARLNRIVDSLLTFARPPRPQLRESDVAEVVRRAFEIEKDRLSKGGISAEFRLRGRLPRIFIDPEQILQVLLNVIRNASDAMPEGGRCDIECAPARRRGHLRRGVGQRKSDRFRAAGEPPAAAYVQVRIGDTGRGIPPDVLPRVFDPFFTTRPKGTGLGLSISQSIVIEHGGFISVRSVQGRGTTVTIDLPVERRRGERRKVGI
jgi:signal transduction histidine kinase